MFGEKKRSTNRAVPLPYIAPNSFVTHTVYMSHYAIVTIKVMWY